MGGLSSGLSLLLLFLASSNPQNPRLDCWYNFLCPFSETCGQEVIPAENADLGLGSQMDYCQQQCSNLVGGTCKHFSVATMETKVYCYLLETCATAIMDSCLEESICNSGPADCDTNDNCPMLTTNPGSSKIRWQCDGVNPYTHVVPDGMTCFLSCNAWTSPPNAIDGTPVLITSTCSGGVYQDSKATPTIPNLPNPLPKPNEEEPTCDCADRLMAWHGIEYDPNTLPGTSFICSESYIIEQKFILKATNLCRLFCDGYHVATMACQGGRWTGHPELGAW